MALFKRLMFLLAVGVFSIWLGSIIGVILGIHNPYVWLGLSIIIATLIIKNTIEK